MKNKKKYILRNQCTSDRIYMTFVYLFSAIAFLVTLYPFIYVVAVSFSGSQAVYRGQVFCWPVDFTLEGYKTVLQQTNFWNSYKNTIIYTGIGTVLNIIATVLAAYPLSRQRFFARKAFNFLIAFTMYFGGGMIAAYIFNTSYGLYNSRWIMWLPTLVGTYNVMICRSAFSAIPDEIMESADIDGANDLQIFYYLAIRLIPSTLAVLTLYYAVALWNEFFTPMVYLSNENLIPVQVILRRVLIQSTSEMQGSQTNVVNSDTAAVSIQIRYVTIVCATLPILAVYPLVQKYFVKGVMLGAVKG